MSIPTAALLTPYLPITPLDEAGLRLFCPRCGAKGHRLSWSMTVFAESALPEGFVDLEPFVADLGRLDTAEQRYLKRQDSPAEALRAFYDMMTPRIAAVLVHLDGHPVDVQLPPKEATLFRVALGFGERPRPSRFTAAPHRLCQRAASCAGRLV